MPWIAIAAAVASAALGGYEQHQALQGADKATAAGLLQQEQLQNKANLQTNKLINQFKTSTQTPYQQQSMGQFMNAIQANQANATNDLNQVGNVSSAYKTAAKNAALGISDYGNTQAGLMSQMNAPEMQRQALSGDEVQYGSALNNLSEQSKQDQFLAQLKAQSQQPNPWLMGISSALGAYARTKMPTTSDVTPGESAWLSSGGTSNLPTTMNNGGYTVNLPTWN